MPRLSNDLSVTVYIDVAVKTLLTFGTLQKSEYWVYVYFYKSTYQKGTWRGEKNMLRELTAVSTHWKTQSNANNIVSDVILDL